MWKNIVGRAWRKTPSFFKSFAIRASQRKFTASVGAVIINPQGKVLLLDHVLRPGSGWGIPGGFMNHNEQPAEAIRRELREETGLEIENVELYSVRAGNRHIEILFRASADGEGLIKSLEINKIGWFEVCEIPPEMSRTQKQIIRRVLEVKDTDN